MNNFEEYRTELDQLRLTDESKQALLRAMASPHASRKPRALRGWRRAVLTAAALCVIVAATAGASQVVVPILQDYYQNSAGYGQSGAELGNSVTKDGWTMTLTDCVGDDYTLYVGIELTAPEGTVLDPGCWFDDWGVRFSNPLISGSCGLVEIDDGDPTDNQAHYILKGKYSLEGEIGSIIGQRVTVVLGGVYHHTVWNEEEAIWEREYDSKATWKITTTASQPDNTIRLEPDIPVETLGVEAAITKVEVSPLGVYVQIEGDALKGHHSWVERNAPDGWYGCIDYQEITLYTVDGQTIPMMERLAGSGCSGGTNTEEPGYLFLVRRSDGLLDLDTLDHISICGTEISLQQ